MVSTLGTNRTICLNYNRGKQCANIAADNSHCVKKNGAVFWHVCARAKANGKACGNNSHSALNH